MTTELEKQFFDTFGIYLREARICRNVNNCSKKYELCNDDCKHWQAIRKEYPQITDSHYLELICLYVSTNDYFKCFADIEKINFRNQILEKYIANKRFFDKHQVQAIFGSNQ